MNQKNFEFVRDQVKFTGFGETLESQLKDKMEKQLPEFQLYHNVKFGPDVATATLQFKKSEQSDLYFFNRYDLTLKHEQADNMMKQTFYVNKTNNITLKEAYNLMGGRAVNKDLTNKDGQVYNAWLQLNFNEIDNNGNFQFRQYHQNYGFDLAKELARLPIKELATDQERTRLVESLHKGNRQVVTFVRGGEEQKMYIEANPRFKSLNIYDDSMRRVHNQSQKEKNSPEQFVQQNVKKERQSQESESDHGFEEPKQKRRRTKRPSIN